MWYVLGATAVALAGIGKGTVKRGTLAKEGAATAVRGRNRAFGNANIPAPTAPVAKNFRLVIIEMPLLPTS
jgi:hypothetical protein